MSENDFDVFAVLLDAAYALYGKALPAEAKAAYFESLKDWPMETVRAALNAHVRDAQRGQFAPKPADLIAQWEGYTAHDGRPEADEAWAIALEAQDAAAAPVWGATAAIRGARAWRSRAPTGGWWKRRGRRGARCIGKPRSVGMLNSAKLRCRRRSLGAGFRHRRQPLYCRRQIESTRATARIKCGRTCNASANSWPRCRLRCSAPAQRVRPDCVNNGKRFERGKAACLSRYGVMRTSIPTHSLSFPC